MMQPMMGGEPRVLEFNATLLHIVLDSCVYAFMRLWGGLIFRNSFRVLVSCDTLIYSLKGLSH
jgi:hypothetical protein